ncbi:iron chaperone [Leptospira sp. GIMC2001]|uniref:iron chaperone n=1 Tax=Leptospira sp. GIMC2001 TaxID=1513297 RepID=UPI00234A5584|nr:DUF1801 domain-containing protein [Leptospira sp. GIMC2001]WCL50009.1 DUF1801 domain-containing protein [Leptospira sp. GIMC2001]
MDTIEQYIHQFPKDVQDILNKIRMIILTIAPDSEEGFAYGMPSYKTHKKPLVYFAAFKKHIGFYATPTGHSKFKAELSVFKQGKGSVQFPLDKPMPYDLISRIVQFRKDENSKLAKG